MDADIRNVALGFVGAAAVLGVLVWVVGAGAVVSAFRMLDPPSLLGIVGLALVWLLFWSVSLRAVLAALDVEVTVVQAFLLYVSAAFANNVTPFGQAGGEPFTALLISRSTGAEYERGLAAIASVDTLNFVPSILLAILGLVYYLVSFTVGDRLLVVAGVVVALAVGVPIGGYLLWRVRGRVQDGIVSSLSPLLSSLGSHVPYFTPPKRPQIRKRVRSFFRSIGRVADDRPALAVALAFSTLGWLCMVVMLWASLYALGHPVLAAVALVAVPVGSIASITPLPGGLGGVEFAIILVIVPVTGVSAGDATAAALVYRAATYWLPTFLGGAAVAWLESV